MKVRDLMRQLLELDPDEDVYFTQERYDYIGTVDLHLVTRVTHQTCVLHERQPPRLLQREPDEDDELETFLVISS